MTTRRLLVAVPDRVSDWVAKGEVVERYFNPGSRFDHVDLLLTNDDRPPGDALRVMAGPASITVHNVPAPTWLFAATLGWRPSLLRPWVDRAVRVVRAADPSLIRCHGARLNALVAARARAQLGIPYVVSLHSNPDTDQLRAARSGPVRRVAGRLVESVERAGLLDADLVLPVYEPIVPYLRRIGVTRFEVAYNVIGGGVRPKRSWDRVEPGVLRAVCVGRQERGEKDPSPIIEAIAELPAVQLHLIGSGPLHDDLRRLAITLGVADRVTFTPVLRNDGVLEALAAADVFVYRSELYEVSKGCIEAALTGLPIVTSDRDGAPAPELVGEHVVLVDGSRSSYREALGRLHRDDALRGRVGRAALAFAQQRWDPARAEARVAGIYDALLAAGRPATT